MTLCPETTIERVVGAVGGRLLGNEGFASAEAIAATGFSARCVVSDGESLFYLALKAVRRVLCGDDPSALGGIVCATFSHEDRFPALSVKIASAIGMSADVPAFDLQMACSAYPYAVYLAGRMSADAGRPVLVVDGDVQSRLSDPADAATAPLFSDAATASLVRSSQGVDAKSVFGFLSRSSDALVCAGAGPIKMDGFKVFSFVASDVVRFLRGFGTDFDQFVPHQANMYMVRQLAKSLGLSDRLVTCGEQFANPGSCSVPLALAAHGRPGRALIAGFGAGLSASAGIVRLADGVAAGVV